MITTHRVAQLALGGSLLLGILMNREVPMSAQGPAARFIGPLSSQPLALTSDSQFLMAVNPDSDSVSFFDLRGDRNRKLTEVKVGNEPNGVAFSPDSRTAYVANTVGGTVSVIKLNLANGSIQKPTLAIPVGTEPYSLLMSPNGTKLYVANARSNNISVIDTSTNTVSKTISDVGFEPRGLAMTNDDDSTDTDETLYVTNFLATPVTGKLDGADDSKEGLVSVISTGTDAVTKIVRVLPLADSGFKATGDALARVAPGDPNDPTKFTFTTGAYPNQFNNVAIKGNFAYLPNTGASPNGPVRFDVNTQSLLAVINRTSGVDAGKTINMHKAVADQTNSSKLFVTLPWAIAFKHQTQDGYVLSASSNVVLHILADGATGLPTVQNDPADASRVQQITVGKNPRGIVINSEDTRAYVMNYISRDISVLALNGGPERVVGTMQSSALPYPGTQEDIIHVGKELYNTSTGEFDPIVQGGDVVRRRMSRNGWGSCAACHPNGLTDNVVWIFPAGPRRTIPQSGDFDPASPGHADMRMLNWSANRDEQEDFESNIRAVSGGPGLIVLPDGSQDPDVNDFRPLSNAGRNQLKVHGVNGWDAIREYVKFGIRTPISPVSKTDPDVISGESLFRAANCQSCHGGASWTKSRVRFTPPPDAGLITAGQIVGELRNVGTFDPTAFNEIRQNAAPPLGAAGFVPPSLLGIHAYPQTFFHNGSVGTLDDVMANTTHRGAGTGGVDTLTSLADRQKLVKFLQSIDSASPAIP